MSGDPIAGDANWELKPLLGLSDYPLMFPRLKQVWDKETHQLDGNQKNIFGKRDRKDDKMRQALRNQRPRWPGRLRSK